MTARRALGAGLALAWGLSTVHAASPIVDIRWDDQGRFVHEASIAPGKFLEVCGALQPGQSIDWSYQSAAALPFNIHYHQGADTVYPVQLKAAQAAQTLKVSAEQAHCWMWTNKSTEAVRVSVSLRRAR